VELIVIEPVTSYPDASHRSLRCERVKGVNLEDGEVANVARHNYQMVHDRGGGDQRILK
jgi:hypothetical protein